MTIIKFLRYSLRHAASSTPRGKSSSMDIHFTLAAKKAATGEKSQDTFSSMLLMRTLTARLKALKCMTEHLLMSFVVQTRRAFENLIQLVIDEHIDFLVMGFL